MSNQTFGQRLITRISADALRIKALEAENADLWAFVRAWDITDQILVAAGLFATIEVDVAVVNARAALTKYEEVGCE